MSITNNEITQNSKSEPKKFSISCTFKERLCTCYKVMGGWTTVSGEGEGKLQSFSYSSNISLFWGAVLVRNGFILKPQNHKINVPSLKTPFPSGWTLPLKSLALCEPILMYDCMYYMCAEYVFKYCTYVHLCRGSSTKIAI